MKKPHDEAVALAEKIGVKLAPEEKDLQEKQLMKVISSVNQLPLNMVLFLIVRHTVYTLSHFIFC